MESRDDPERFGFWLAEVVERALYNYCRQYAPKKYKKDRVDIIPGEWYMKVKIIDRFPVDSPTMFRLKAAEPEWMINAEALLLRNVKVTEVALRSTPRRLTRGEGLGAPARTHLFELNEAELERCTDAAEEKLDAEGGHKHDNLPQPEPLLARNRTSV